MGKAHRINKRKKSRQSEFAFMQGLPASSSANNYSSMSITSRITSDELGIGTELDPMKSARYRSTRIPTQDILRANLSSGLTANIVNIYTETAFSKKIVFSNTKKTGKLEKLEKTLSSLNILDEMRMAFKLTFLKGCSIIILGISENTDEWGTSSSPVPPDRPLDFNKLKSIDWARCIDRDSFYFEQSDIETKTSSPNYGNPIYYYIKAGADFIKFHHTKVLVFNGRHYIKGTSFSTPVGGQTQGVTLTKATQQPYQDLKDSFLGTSYIEPMLPSIQNYEVAMTVTTSLMLKNTKEVVTYDPKLDNGSVRDKNHLQESIATAITSKGGIGTIVLPAWFKLEMLHGDLSSNSAIIEALMRDVCATCGINQLHLFNIAPAGIGSNRLAEMTTFNGRVHGIQESMLRTPIQKLLDIINVCSDYAINFKDLPSFDFPESITASDREHEEIRGLKLDNEKKMLENLMLRNQLDPENLLGISVESYQEV